MNKSFTRKIVGLIPGLLLLFVLAACTPTGGQSELPTPIPPVPTLEPTEETMPEPAPITDIHWSLLHTIVGGDAAVPVPTDVIANMTIIDGMVSGSSGCNRFSGTVSVEGQKLTFGPLATTRMACMEIPMAFESDFLNVLSQVGGYTLIEGNLELQNADGLPLALFVPATEKTLFVGPEQVDCVGEAPQKCYLVADAPDGEYLFFYDTIAGFEWEPGYDYEVRVNVIPVPNPPADASSLRYELIEVVSQTAVDATDPGDTADPAEAADLVGPTWQWLRLADTGGNESLEVSDPAQYTIKFLADGTYELHNDCNSGSGRYEIDGPTLTILPGITTLAACGEQSLDIIFATQLAEVTGYIIEGDQLLLALAPDTGHLVFSPAQ